MQTITTQNLFAAEPLTPLNIGEAFRYVGCNLTNRLVHPLSEVVDCQVSQIIFDGLDDHWIGAGVRGEITNADVEAAGGGA